MILVRALAVACALLAIATGVQSVRLSAAKTEHALHLKADAEAAEAAQRAARAAERATVLRHNEALAQLEKERDDALAKADAVAADVRAGTLRLRDHWACPARNVPGAAPAAPGRDEGAELRAADSGRLVQIGAEADAALRACQAVIRADRE